MTIYPGRDLFNPCKECGNVNCHNPHGAAACDCYIHRGQPDELATLRSHLETATAENERLTLENARNVEQYLAADAREGAAQAALETARKALEELAARGALHATGFERHGFPDKPVTWTCFACRAKYAKDGKYLSRAFPEHGACDNAGCSSVIARAALRALDTPAATPGASEPEEATTFRVRAFVCPQCGPAVVDEDGCCKQCGRDAPSNQRSPSRSSK